LKNNLKTSIEQLYKTFEKFQINSKIEGCPCCVSKEDRFKLHSKELKELTDEDLSYYTFKAITTFGNPGDFKHFLPRIFELMATYEISVDTFVILGKLEKANWQIWSELEKESVRKFLLAWWSELNQEKQHYSFSEEFMEIYKIVDDLPLLLSNWIITSDSESVQNLSLLIVEDIKSILRGNKDYEALKQSDREYFISWLQDQQSKLSEAYNYFVEKHPESSWQIANAVNILKYDLKN